jgi:hypothetical protein
MTGYLLVCARAMVGVVLFVSAASKVRSRAAFAGFGAWLRQLTVGAGQPGQGRGDAGGDG